MKKAVISTSIQVLTQFMKIKSHTFFYVSVLLAAFLLSISVSSCRKENFLNDSGVKLQFSKDTVVFDTVFSTIGSTYRRLIVTNSYNQPIVVSQIRLGKGTASAYRMNVDGLSGVIVKDLEIPAKDSIYVFVEVTIDPTNANNPFVVEDKIHFVTNGNSQSVELVAWGQNAYFHYNEVVCGETWAVDKPHVLYGITAVGFPRIDSNCTLTIPAGAQIYAHTGAVLYVYKSSLFVNGTESNRVVFQGDRREASYANEPGQWFGVRFAIARNSLINYAVIKNATAGIYIDTAFGGDSLTINGVESFNHSFASLFAQGARVHATNSKFNKAGNNAVSLRLGGEYYFNHCTINNFWTATSRSSPALVLNNYYEANSTIYVRPIVRASFNNSIIYGDIDNEIVIDTVPGNFANYRFNHCLVKTDQPINSNFVNIKRNLSPNYTSNSSLKLKSSSVCIGQADPVYFLSTDLENNSRSNPADIGCYEYVP